MRVLTSTGWAPTWSRVLRLWRGGRGWAGWLAVIVLTTLLAGPASLAAAPEAQPNGQKGEAVVAAWVELGPGGAASARAVVSTGRCPDLQVDGAARPMAVRAAPSGPEWPVLVCEAAVPAGAARLSVEGLALPAPVAAPRRVLVVGDTGCRVLGDIDQPCNDPEGWPFARIAATAAAWAPEVIIHVGDYVYREEPCPAGNAGCAGSPYGDNWATWNAEFFTPTAPLLRVAPWVFVRGNHELCSREGPGWFRLLEPRPLPAACTDVTPPYSLPLGEVELLMLDSSNANDMAAAPDQVALYADQFAALAARAAALPAGRSAWLLTHRPLWAVGLPALPTRPAPAGQAPTSAPPTPFTTNPTLQAASGNTLPPNVSLVLSGHLHVFEVVSFAGQRAPQFVVGDSGTYLDQQVDQVVGLTVGGATIVDGVNLARFGFMTLEPAAGDWVATAHDPAGRPFLRCLVPGPELRCARPVATAVQPAAFPDFGSRAWPAAPAAVPTRVQG